MQLLLLISVVWVACALATAADIPKNVYHRNRRQFPSQSVPPELSSANLDVYLKNPRAVQSQLRCIVYNGPCDRIGKYLKANLPVWLATQCRNCNAAQRTTVTKLVTFLETNYPKEWNDAIQKYKSGRISRDLHVSRLGLNAIPATDASSPVSSHLDQNLSHVGDEAAPNSLPHATNSSEGHARSNKTEAEFKSNNSILNSLQ